MHSTCPRSGANACALSPARITAQATGVVVGLLLVVELIIAVLCARAESASFCSGLPVVVLPADSSAYRPSQCCGRGKTPPGDNAQRSSSYDPCATFPNN